MDTFFIEAVVQELTGRTAGARIDKIHQPEAEIFILRLWTGRETLRLLLDFGGDQARLHLTEGRWGNPFTPPRFCQLLRSRLARIIDIKKVAHERIVHFACKGITGEDYLLIAELLGSQANLLLLNGEGKIVDSLKRHAGGRNATPGQPYRPPPTPNRYSLADPLPVIPPETVGSSTFERWLLDHITPMSPPVAADLAVGVAGGAAPAKVLADLRRRWLAREFRPAIASWGGQSVLTALPLSRLPLTDIEEFSSPSSAADRFYSTASAPAAGQEEVRSAITRGLRRLHGRMKKIEADRQQGGGAEQEREMGELLLINLHRLRRGMQEVTVENYFADPPSPLRIPLNPRLSPQENAERYFRGYKKKQRGREHVVRRFRETGEEIVWLEEVAHFFEEVQTGEELAAIRRELVEAGLLPAVVAHAPRQKTPAIRDTLRRGQTPGGFHLWWGKNSRSNEYVSRELTGPEDLWFHAHNRPGCHLVLKRAGQPAVPEEDQLFAAAVAAGYSQARGDGKVEVIIAEGKYVRQPKGARPGQVGVERFRTLMVEPQRIEETDL